MTAERILTVLFKNLEDAMNPFADELLSGLKDRITQRRPDTLIHLMEYLYNPAYFKENSKDQFGKSTKKQKAIDLASEQLERLFSIVDDEADAEQDSPIETPTLSFAEEMEAAIQSIGNVDPGQSKKAVSKKTLKKELALFEESGNRTANLDALINALNSIQPTSCESEGLNSILLCLSNLVNTSMHVGRANILILTWSTQPFMLSRTF